MIVKNYSIVFDNQKEFNLVGYSFPEVIKFLSHKTSLDLHHIVSVRCNNRPVPDQYLIRTVSRFEKKKDRSRI